MHRIPTSSRKILWGKMFNIVDDETKFDGKRNQETPPNIAATIKSLRVELQGCRKENEWTNKDLEEKNQLTAAML